MDKLALKWTCELKYQVYVITLKNKRKLERYDGL